MKHLCKQFSQLKRKLKEQRRRQKKLKNKKNKLINICNDYTNILDEPVSKYTKFGKSNGTFTKKITYYFIDEKENYEIEYFIKHCKLCSKYNFEQIQNNTNFVSLLIQHSINYTSDTPHYFIIFFIKNIKKPFKQISINLIYDNIPDYSLITFKFLIDCNIFTNKSLIDFEKYIYTKFLIRNTIEDLKTHVKKQIIWSGIRKLWIELVLSQSNFYFD